MQVWAFLNLFQVDTHCENFFFIVNGGACRQDLLSVLNDFVMDSQCLVAKTYSFLHRNRIRDKPLYVDISVSEKPSRKLFLHIPKDIPRQKDVSEVERTDRSTEE